MPLETVSIWGFVTKFGKLKKDRACTLRISDVKNRQITK